jgi:DNA-binding MltR family transcriptional regulator
MDKNDEDQKDDDSIVGKVKRLTKVNNITTIDSISEKNEESSNSNIKNSNLQSQNILFRNTNTPEMTQIVNNLNVRLKKPKR